MELNGKTVVITGSSRGIGRETALKAANEGAYVVVNYVSGAKEAEKVVDEIKSNGGGAIAVQADVSLFDEAKRLIETAHETYGSVDILINNAGLVSWEPLTKEKIEHLHRIIDVNFTGLVNTSYATIPLMAGQPNGGVIVNISSGAGKTGYADLAVYSASKFAVLGLTEALGKELSSDNVRVYAVCPGMTATDMTNQAGMAPQKVADRIIQTAKEELGLSPGEDTEIYQ